MPTEPTVQLLPGQVQCAVCHYVWFKRSWVGPKRCPSQACQSPYWKGD